VLWDRSFHVDQKIHLTVLDLCFLSSTFTVDPKCCFGHLILGSHLGKNMPFLWILFLFVWGGDGDSIRAVESEFKSNLIFPFFSDFIRLYPIFIPFLSHFFRFLDFSRLLDLPIPQL